MILNEIFLVLKKSIKHRNTKNKSKQFLFFYYNIDIVKIHDYIYLTFLFGYLITGINIITNNNNKLSSSLMLEWVKFNIIHNLVLHYSTGAWKTLKSYDFVIIYSFYPRKIIMAFNNQFFKKIYSVMPGGKTF